jgi:hypothetical protein
MRILLVLAGLSFSSILTPRDASAQVKDMCSLLTQAEAEAILGRKPLPPQKQTSGDCWYASGEIMLHAIPRPFASAAELKAQVVSDVKRINDRTKAKGVALNIEMSEVTVPGADAAFYDSFSLHVLKGKRVLTIVGDKAIAVKVAEKAVPRW